MLQKRVFFPLVVKCSTQIVCVEDRVDKQNIAMQIFMWRHQRNFLKWIYHEKLECVTEDFELIQRNSVEMLLFYFKYARCIVSHVGEVALKLLSTFTTFQLQFGIYLREWVFFLKNSQVQIFFPNWTRWKNRMITYQYYKHEKFPWMKCRKIFLEAIFFSSRKLLDIISLQNFLLSSSQSSSRITIAICTSVTLSALVLHLNCTAVSQSESNNFFMFITCISRVTYTSF